MREKGILVKGQDKQNQKKFTCGFRIRFVKIKRGNCHVHQNCANRTNNIMYEKVDNEKVVTTRLHDEMERTPSY